MNRMQKDNSEKSKLTYKRAPVAEVFASVQFADIEPLKAAHIAEIWQAFGGKKAYPHYEEHPLLPKQPLGAVGVSFLTKPPMPRQWFMDADQSMLLQLQKDRLSCNWQKMPGKPYPRYEQLIATFQDAQKKLWDFIASEAWPAPRIEQLELGYVNIIPFTAFSDDDSLSNIGSIFRDVSWAGGNRFLPPPAGINLQWQFPMPENLFTGHVQIVTVQNPEDSQPALRFGLHAIGGIPSGQAAEMLAWFANAHDWITKAFDDLITQTMHTHWEKQL